MGIVARFGLRQPEYCATAISAAFTRPYLLLGHRAQGCVPTASQVRRAAARTIAPHQHPHGSSTLTAPPTPRGLGALATAAVGIPPGIAEPVMRWCTGRLSTRTA